MKKIYILLTKYQSFAANVMTYITRFNYTHASIGLEEDMNTFYSFVNKGFIEEKINRYVKPGRKPFKCKLFELEVTEKVYNAIKSLIEKFKAIKEQLQYSKKGLAFCFLHIPYKKQNKYFCSQFVASILEKSEAVKLKKNSSLYLPKDFTKIKNIKEKFTVNHGTFLTRFNIPQYAR